MLALPRYSPRRAAELRHPSRNSPAPEVVSPDKAPAPEQAAPAQTEKDADAPKEQKAASVSVFNFSEIMAEKKAAEKAATQQEAKTPDKVASHFTVQGGRAEAGKVQRAGTGTETPGPTAQGRQGQGCRSCTEGSSRQEG